VSGTFQLDSELFPKDPLTKRWTRERTAVSSVGEGIFLDFWRLECRFGTLDTQGESDFFMNKFLASGLHSAVLPHPEDGSLQTFTGVAIADYNFTFGDVDRDAFALNPVLILAGIPANRV
jgi:hypothetical protein